MAATELLRKLTLKTVKLETAGTAAGLLSWEDVAGALTGLPPECTWYAYALFECNSNDKRGIPNKYTQLLIDRITTKVWSRMRERKFNPRTRTQGEVAMGIAKAAVHCVLNAKGACYPCGGSGEAIRDGIMQTCKSCNGHGIAEFNNADKYEVGFGDGTDATRAQRRWYKQQCGDYDEYASQLLSGIISRVADKLNYAKREAKQEAHIDYMEFMAKNLRF